MTKTFTFFEPIVAFAFVALASSLIGRGFVRLGLPLITGFLLAGLVAGPSVLELIPASMIGKFRFLDETALGFIAMAAGGELFLRDLRGGLKRISLITVGLVASTFTLGGLTVYLLSEFIPFLASMPPMHRIAVGGLAGAILVARSPSSAIAIVRELRAKGNFTRTVLGVTVIMDVVVIILFAGNSAFADAILTNIRIGIGFFVLLLCELTVSLIVGLAVGKLLAGVLSLPARGAVKGAGILLTGYLVFFLSHRIQRFSLEFLSFDFIIEPLFVCMVAGFFVTNRSAHRIRFSHILHDTGPPVYVVFFTLTGAAIELRLLGEMWGTVLVLFFARLIAISVGTTLGGLAARSSRRHLRVSWMAYVTQAGVGLGLAKQSQCNHVKCSSVPLRNTVCRGGWVFSTINPISRRVGIAGDSRTVR